MNKICIVCNLEYIAKHWAVKTCSKRCRAIHANQRKNKTIQNHLETFSCKYCNKEVTRYRKRNGFCSRSCASMSYIEDGTYDGWRLKIQTKKGLHKRCIICNAIFYAEPRQIDNKKLCGSVGCKKRYMSDYMKKNNPSMGKKEKSDVREKVKKTLLKKYGVDNAFLLAKHTSLSKPQKEILNYLRKNTNFTILSDFPIYNGETFYKVDILIKELNTIVEFNGSYWHADSRLYESTYYNKKKNMLAKDIWEADEKRINFLKEKGFLVKVIWELDYNSDKSTVLKEILYG